MANSTVATLFGQLAQATQEKQRQQQLNEQIRQFDVSHLLDQMKLNQQQNQFTSAQQQADSHFQTNMGLQKDIAGFNMNKTMIDLIGSGSIKPTDMTATEDNLVPGGVGVTSPMTSSDTVSLGGRPFSIVDQFILGQTRKRQEAQTQADLVEQEQKRQMRLLRDSGFNPAEAIVITMNPGAGIQFANSQRDPRRALANQIINAKDPDDIKSAFALMQRLSDAEQPQSRTAMENAHAQYYLNQLQQAQASSNSKALISKGARFGPQIVANLRSNLNTPEGLKEAYTYINNAPWSEDDKQAATAWLAGESNLNSAGLDPMKQMMAAMLNGGAAVPQPATQVNNQDPNKLMQDMLNRIKELQDENNKIRQQTPVIPNNNPNRVVDQIFNRPNR